MFLGHFAIGFASKPLAPRASLGWLMAAPLFPDLIWPIFLKLGWESVRIDPGNTVFTPLAFDSYPISHSLLATIGWGAALGLLYVLLTNYHRGGIVIACGVVSHWLCDLVAHRPDLPLYPGGPKLGFGLWNSAAGTMALEFALFVWGVYSYFAVTRREDPAGSWGFVTFSLVVGLIYLANAFGPPPPSVAVIENVALAAWIFPVFAGWFDSRRITLQRF